MYLNNCWVISVKVIARQIQCFFVNVHIEREPMFQFVKRGGDNHKNNPLTKILQKRFIIVGQYL